MNKKIILVLLFLLFGGICFLFINGQFKSEMEEENVSKHLHHNSVVVYFSATGTTRKIANYISEITNSNVMEIVPLEPYTEDDLDYNNDNSRANREQNENARPKIKNELDLSDYDTVYLGYPIWWGDVPKIILTFLENSDLYGKTIISFCTSSSSSMSTSIHTLKSYGLNLFDGKRFGSSTTKKDVESWIKAEV